MIRGTYPSAAMIVLWIVGGCSPSIPEPNSEHPHTKVGFEGMATSRGILEFDLGPILSKGQTIHHEFTLSNPSTRPVHIRSAEALTPCCSSVGPLPKLIPPGGMVQVPVFFRPGRDASRKKLVFRIHTDEFSHPVRHLALLATVIPEVEVRLDEGSDVTLPIGRSGHQRLVVTCHHLGDDGLGDPSDVMAPTPLSAEFVTPASEKAFPNGLVKTVRLVDVAIPATFEEGQQKSLIYLDWPGGKRREHPITWQVSAPIQATPSGFVLRAETGPEIRDVLLHSTDRPVRVLDVSGPILAKPVALPSVAANVQRLRLVIDPAPTGAGTWDIGIRTDRPEQSTVFLSVLVIPDMGGTNE